MKFRNRGAMLLALVGVVLWATAIRWVITPINHPDASALRTAAVWLQALVGVVLTVAGYRQDRRERASAPKDEVL